MTMADTMDMMVDARKLRISDANERAKAEADPSLPAFTRGIAKRGVMMHVQALPAEVKVFDGPRMAWEGHYSAIPPKVRALLTAKPLPAKLAFESFEVFDGRRRVLAAQACVAQGGEAARVARMVPVRVHLSGVDMVEAAIRSSLLNTDREGPDPFDRAEHLSRLLRMEAAPGVRRYATIEALASEFERSVQTISGWLSFLKLGDAVRQAYRAQVIGRRVAEDIAQLAPEHRKQELLVRALQGRPYSEQLRVLALARASPAWFEKHADPDAFAAVVARAMDGEPATAAASFAPPARREENLAPLPAGPKPGNPRGDDAVLKHLRAVEAEARAPPDARVTSPTSAPAPGLSVGHDGRVHVEVAPGASVAFTMDELGLQDHVLVPRSALKRGAASEPWTETLQARVRDAARSAAARTRAS